MIRILQLTAPFHLALAPLLSFHLGGSESKRVIEVVVKQGGGKGAVEPRVLRGTLVTFPKK